MILNDVTITKLAVEQEMIFPFKPDLVQPASYDLTLSPDLVEIVYGGIVSASDHPGKVYRDNKVRLQAGQEYLLQPGAFVLACSAEYVKLPPDVAGQVMLRSTTARRGIGHVYSGWIDPGFQGNITFELFSHIPTVLVPGRAICQMVFYRLEAVPAKPYHGKYQFQQGPTPARQLSLDEAFTEAFVIEPKSELAEILLSEAIKAFDLAKPETKDETILSEYEIKRRALRSQFPLASDKFEWAGDDE